MRRKLWLVLTLVGIMSLAFTAMSFADEVVYPRWTPEERIAVVEERLEAGAITQEQADLILQHIERGLCDPENPAMIGQQARIGFGRALAGDDFVPGQGRGAKLGQNGGGFGQRRGGGQGQMLRDGSCTIE
jgi:hypothetical protein